MILNTMATFRVIQISQPIETKLAGWSVERLDAGGKSQIVGDPFPTQSAAFVEAERLAFKEPEENGG